MTELPTAATLQAHPTLIGRQSHLRGQAGLRGRGLPQAQ